MKKISSIPFLLILLNLLGQTDTAVLSQRSKKYNIQIDSGINYFRYSRFEMIRQSEYPFIESHYEATTIDKQLNPIFFISMELRNYEYKRITDMFDTKAIKLAATFHNDVIFG